MKMKACRNVGVLIERRNGRVQKLPRAKLIEIKQR